MAAQIALKREDDDIPPTSQFRDAAVSVEPVCVGYRSPPTSSEPIPNIVCPPPVQVDANNNNTSSDDSNMMDEARAKHDSLSSGQGEKLKNKIAWWLILF